MGSPAVFIHSGTLGGRLPELSLPAEDSLPRPPAITVPPSNAPPWRRNRRRDGAALSVWSGLVIGLLRPRAAWINLPDRQRQRICDRADVRGLHIFLHPVWEP